MLCPNARQSDIFRTRGLLLFQPLLLLLHAEFGLEVLPQRHLPLGEGYHQPERGERQPDVPDRPHRPCEDADHLPAEPRVPDAVEELLRGELVGLAARQQAGQRRVADAAGVPGALIVEYGAGDGDAPDGAEVADEAPEARGGRHVALVQGRLNRRQGDARQASGADGAEELIAGPGGVARVLVEGAEEAECDGDGDEAEEVEGLIAAGLGE